MPTTPSGTRENSSVRVPMRTTVPSFVRCTYHVETRVSLIHARLPGWHRKARQARIARETKRSTRMSESERVCHFSPVAPYGAAVLKNRFRRTRATR